MALDPDQCTVCIRFQSSRYLKVMVQNNTVPDDVWQRSSLLCELVEQSRGRQPRGSLEPTDISVPFSAADIVLWMKFDELGQYDVAARCRLLEAASFLDDEQTVAAAAALVASAIRTALIHYMPSTSGARLLPAEYPSRAGHLVPEYLAGMKGEECMIEVEDATDLLQQLPAVEQQLVAQLFSVYELLNAPVFLLRARLQQLLTQTGTLDLSSVEASGDSTVWRTCMKRLLGEAAIRPFTSVIVPNCLGRQYGRRGARPALERLREYDLAEVWTVHMQDVTSIEFHPCQCNPSPAVSEYTEVITCPCMPMLCDVHFVCGALQSMPSLRAVSLPCFVFPAQSGSDTSSSAHRSSFCSFDDFGLIAKVLSGLRCLQNLHVRQLPEISYVQTLLSCISTLSSLTKLVIDPCVDWERGHLGANKLLALRGLRHLRVPLTSCARSRQPKGVQGDLERDIREGLLHDLGTCLTALTFLRVDYLGKSTYAVERKYSAEILAAVADTLRDLKELRVLHLMLPVWCCVPVLHDKTPAAKQLLEYFTHFARRLDDIIIRGVGNDLLYPVNSKWKDVRMRSLHWADSGLPVSQRLSQPCRPPRYLIDISTLLHLTALNIRIDHSGKFTDEYVEGLSEGLVRLHNLRQLRIVQSQKAAETPWFLESIAELGELRELDIDGIVASSWEGVGNHPAAKFVVASSLTSLRLTGAPNGRMEYVAQFIQRLEALVRLEVLPTANINSPFFGVVMKPCLPAHIDNHFGGVVLKPCLKHLHVAVSFAIDTEKNWIAKLQGLQSLTFLDLTLQVNPTEDHFQLLADSLRSLSRLRSCRVWVQSGRGEQQAGAHGNVYEVIDGAVCGARVPLYDLPVVGAARSAGSQW